MDAVKTKEPSKHVRHFEVSKFVITHNASSSAKRSILSHSTSQQQRKLDCVLLQSLLEPLSNRDECSRVSFLYLAINHKRKPIDSVCYVNAPLAQNSIGKFD